MKSFLIAECPECGFRYWSVNLNKNSTCPKCGHKYYLNKKKPETGANSQSAFPEQK